MIYWISKIQWIFLILTMGKWKLTPTVYPEINKSELEHPKSDIP